MDLNLLVVFRAVMEHRGLTRAGNALGLSQPAMSASLSRLRDLYGDPLFIRSGTEMKPTPLAEELAGPLCEILDRLESDVLRRGQFDPATARRTFTLVMPDIGELQFLPVLLAWFETHAPGISLHTIARHPQATPSTLESGEAELAVGFFPDLHRPGFFQQKLFDVRDVCMVRKDHPLVGDRLSIEQFLAASHAVIRPDGRVVEGGNFPPGVQERVRVAVTVSHFTSLLNILRTSNLVATVPLPLAGLLDPLGQFRTLELPWESAAVPIHQFWHSRHHKDPANMWLRRLIYERFGGTGTA